MRSSNQNAEFVAIVLWSDALTREKFIVEVISILDSSMILIVSFRVNGFFRSQIDESSILERSPITMIE